MKHVARKRFGQHFLADVGIIDAIVREIAPKPGQAMVEIGPGLAALTQPLVERLICTLESGRDVGGQGSNGQKMPERSACVVVMDRKSYAAWDLRVDLHKTAVEELRRLYTAFKPYQPHYEDRDEDPSHCPTQLSWERESLTDIQRREALTF